MLHNKQPYEPFPKIMEYDLKDQLLVFMTYYTGIDTSLSITRDDSGGYILRGYKGHISGHITHDRTLHITATMLSAFRSQNAILAGWIDALSTIHSEGLSNE